MFTHAQGGTQIYVNFPIVEKMELLLPKCYSNQLLIGNISKLLNTIILNSEQKLEILNKLKKGLMQSMFV